VRPAIVAALLLVAAPAAAADRAAARAAYDEAVKHYNLGEFQQALDGFTVAYRETADPTLLFNLAQCSRKLGDHQKAVLLYRSYLRASGDATNTDEVKRLIASLEEDIRREQESKQAPPQGVEPAAPSPPPMIDGHRRTVAGLPYVPPTPAPPTIASWATPTRRAGVGLMAGGAALAIVGFGLAGSAPGIVGDADRASTMADAQATYNRAVAFNQAGWALVGVGAAAAAAGVVLLALPRRGGALQAFVSPSGVGVKGGW
jgi:tetratricopeptide (TPR) repeat protein